MGARFRVSSFLAASIVCAHCAGSSNGGGTGGGANGGSGGSSPSGEAGNSGAAPAGEIGLGSSSDNDGGGGNSLSGTSGGSGDSDAGGGAGFGLGDSGGGGIGSGNCGTRTGMRGKTTRSLMVGSASRTYIAYLPQSARPTTALPFVYVFHGATQTGSNLFDTTQYSSLADSEGIAVVFPDGQGTSSVTSTGALNPWNVSDNGAAVCGAGDLVSNPNAVDFAFVDAIKADVLQDQCLDAAHTFATGFSMGGYFTHHIACDRTDFKAAAPHSGGTLADLSGCKTGHVPVIIFHGTADPLIAPGCDDPNSTAQSGFPPSATLWAQKNGCQTTYTTIAENGSGGNDGQCYLYNGCPKDGQVELCTFTNLSHAWAGATVCPGCIGSGSNFASATQLEWSFFKHYAW